MEEKEYLQTLGEQILNPHARTHVLEEIQEHIDEQMQDYIDTGMSPDAAEKEAVRQMGDPVAAGTELNRIHRPRFPGVLFGIAVVLTLSGIFMQYILYGSEPLNTTYSNTAFMQHAVFYQMIGFGIILFGMFSKLHVFVKIQLVFIRSVFGICAARLLLSGHVLFLADPYL